MLTVFVIDDDIDIRDYIMTILESIQIPVICFANADEFLNFHTPDVSGCILSDVLMPDMDGLEFQNELLRRKIGLPLILMSSYGNVGMVKTILKNGAIDFLEKPLNTKELVDSIKNAISLANSQEAKALEVTKENARFKQKLNALTDREKQILTHLMKGENNASVALTLNISIRTVETHRSRVLKKMEFSSLQELITYSYNHSIH